MPSRPDPLFAVAERLILSLYDGGVLSPAVLQRVIASLAATRWETRSDSRANDQRSLPEVVVSVMMPGNALDNVDQDYAAVIDHLVGAAKETARPVSGDDRRAAGKPRKRSAAPQIGNDDAPESELLEQLAGTRATSNKKAKPSRAGRNTQAGSGFNPLQNAAPPKKR
ncbi:hypothetical protein [Paraburkholderia fynbosensis]|uniref:Uncharacterized protein n=1 Tax=Paraburkholderia fynbosensis TaxID=1200993 RepID=A0A6J5FXY2_9BURK|nr:hypothetical protein [Paraburkholderia fynbosensis]CAB3788076.1 hypothetical protein LMG27177_02324 [Paraburkholderia fynbosensis]